MTKFETIQHGGIDYSCHGGEPVHCWSGGLVTSIEFGCFGRGESVTIESAGGDRLYYYNMEVLDVKLGDTVAPGDIIGRMKIMRRETTSCHE